MVRHTKRNRRVSSRRHRKYGHRGGYSSSVNSSYQPATYNGASTSSTTVANDMTSVPANTSLATFFKSGSIDTTNPHMMTQARNDQQLIQNAGGASGASGKAQKGGVWNQMIGDAIAPLVLLGLQQYYSPRSRSMSNRKSYKGNKTRRYRR